MALTINDIFPCASESMRILEPSKCLRFPTFPGIVNESESRIVYRRRWGKSYSRFQYSYDNIMCWEYDLILDFFSRMKGRYSEFYLVDWSRGYRIRSVANSSSGSCDYILQSVSGLTASTGYVGNTLLLYNPRYDPARPSGAVTDKNIVTINTRTVNTNTITTTKNQTGRQHLDNSASTLYILVPVIFDVDSLSPQSTESCIEDNARPYFPGYGNQYIFGNIYTINLAFLQIGVNQE